jgi:hypothetical protein
MAGRQGMLSWPGGGSSFRRQLSTPLLGSCCVLPGGLHNDLAQSCVQLLRYKQRQQRQQQQLCDHTLLGIALCLTPPPPPPPVLAAGRAHQGRGGHAPVQAAAGEAAGKVQGAAGSRARSICSSTSTSSHGTSTRSSTCPHAAAAAASSGVQRPCANASPHAAAAAANGTSAGLCQYVRSTSSSSPSVSSRDHGRQQLPGSASHAAAAQLPAVRFQQRPR